VLVSWLHPIAAMIGGSIFCYLLWRCCRAVGLSALLLVIVSAAPAFAFDNDPDNDSCGEFVVSAQAAPVREQSRSASRSVVSCIQCTDSLRLRPTAVSVSSRNSLRNPQHSRSPVFQRAVSTGS
jgi:hypothetical protein